jgi:hypothetical protein
MKNYTMIQWLMANTTQWQNVCNVTKGMSALKTQHHFSLVRKREGAGGYVIKKLIIIT